jgi:alpha-beta hydrolase superfamily lysophospholipase
MPSRGRGDTRDLAKEFSAACADWGRAVAAVDGQMAALKKALIASGDVEYEEIAESQLAGVLGSGPKQLTAILGQSGGGDAAALRAAAGKVLSVLTNVDKTVLTNPAVAVCEANPVRVPVAIRATLGPPMARLRALLIQASA